MAQTLAQKKYWTTGKGKATQWRNQLRIKYRITENEYNVMLARQGGACAICRRAETFVLRGAVARLAVDHDHACCPGKKSCGKCVRGLLCSACNTALARLKDDPGTARAMADYLETRQ